MEAEINPGLSTLGPEPQARTKLSLRIYHNNSIYESGYYLLLDMILMQRIVHILARGKTTYIYKSNLQWICNLNTWLSQGIHCALYKEGVGPLDQCLQTGLVKRAANSSLQPACDCIGKRFKMPLQRDVSPGTAFEKRGTGVYAEGIRQQNTYLSPMYHISVSFTVDSHADNVSYAGPAAEPMQFLLPSAPINMEAMSVAGVYSSRAISMINYDIYSIPATRMPTAWIRPILPGISSSLLRSRL